MKSVYYHLIYYLKFIYLFIINLLLKIMKMIFEKGNYLAPSKQNILLNPSKTRILREIVVILEALA